MSFLLWKYTKEDDGVIRRLTAKCTFIKVFVPQFPTFSAYRKDDPIACPANVLLVFSSKQAMKPTVVVMRRF